MASLMLTTESTSQGNKVSEFNNSAINFGKSENDSTETKVFTTVTQIQVTEVTVEPKDLDSDIVILRKDPTTRRNLINKSAYAKLHRTLSPDRSNTIDSLKEKYESKPDVIDVKSNQKNGEITQPGENKSQSTPTKLDEETVQSLKDKYSPARFGYPKIAPKPSKLPLAKPRSAVKSQIILPSTKPSDKEKARYSLNVDRKSKSKDENSNEVHRKDSSSSGEFVTIITRSESEGSVDKVEKELNLFMMDTKPKEKKRASSFRKIFSGKIFGKDKKKKEDEKDKNKTQFKQNVADVHNLQNETNSFNRQTNYRHTVGGNSNIRPKEPRAVIRSDSDRYSNQQNQYITKEMEDRYAQMHVNQFNHIKHAFEITNSGPVVKPIEGYVPMDKPIVKNNPGPTNYMNLPNVRKYIDTSSSASTLESDRSNSQNEVAQINREIERRNEEARNDNFNSLKSVRFEGSNENTRDTPPRAQELRQDVRLVNPKALIPINSERPLPNPYQNSNSSTLDRPRPSPQLNQMENTNKPNQTRPHLEETYGIVFDSIDYKDKSAPQTSPKINELKNDHKPPRSPSVEGTKLKLPPNREIVPLSPRVKSPIPHDNVSTEKIIATELLKPLKSPTLTRKSNPMLSSPSHQKLEIDIDYPDNINNERHEKRTIEKSKPPLVAKPPISKIPFRRSPEASSSSANSLTRQSTSQNSLAFENKRLSQTSPASENLENTYARYTRSQASPVVENQERIITNAMVHVNSNVRSPTPNSLLNNRPLSPATPSIRSSTPVEFRTSPTTKSSPQKQEMRKSVEAFYWKELKKLKDQENYEMYLYQMQMMPYGYAEDPVSVRRSRSLSPTTHRNSRRSLSLPRDTRPTNVNDVPDMYGRIQPAPIPEGRAVMHQQIPQRNVIYGQLQYQPNFRRNAPERRTIDSTPRSYENYNNTYRPIFKRGSLSTPVKEQEEMQNKKVSFSGSNPQNVQVWPTRNGFTQSPPQRRVDNNRLSTVEDDVFLPNTPRTPIRYDGNEIYGYVSKPIRYDYGPNPNEVLYYSRQNMEMQNTEPIYDRNPNLRYNVNYSQDENPYGQQVDQVKAPYRMTRHGSIQLQEPLYDQRQLVSRRRSFENGQVRPIQDPQYTNRQPNQMNATIGIRREIILNDEIFGQFGGYVQPNDERYFQNKKNAIYSSKQSMAEPLYGRTGPKQVSVRNKVCDIYGQIHDTDSSAVSTPTQIRRTGVIMGQLQSNPGSPQVVRQSQATLTNEQFARNTRLTASANDMYRRYQNVDPRYRSDVVYDGTRYQQQQQQQEIVAPTRPLPPVPTKKGLMRNGSGKSDTDSDASEMHRLNNGAKNKKRSFFEEEWNADGKSGRGISGNDSGRSDNEGGEVRGRSRNTRRDDPRRHTLGGDQQYLAMAGQGGPLSRTMDLEGQPRGYPPPSNAMLFDDDPGIMSEVETSSTGFRRGGKQRSSLPVVRTPSKTLERPLGLVFLQYRNETKRALLPNEITSIDTVKALFVRSFPKQLTMEYLDSPNVKIYIHDSSKDMFYELEDLRSHLREIRDRSVLRLFESADVSGGLPMAGIGIAGGVGHFEDPSYFSEPEFDSEYQHQHIHKSKGSAGKSAPYYMGSTASLPRGATLLRTYSPAVTAIPAERIKTLPTGAPPKPQRAYSTGAPRSSDGPPRPPDRFVPFQRPANPLYNIPDGYMSSPERGSRYEDPYYSQYATRSGSITPVIDEEISDTELLDDSYSLYGVKLPPGSGPRVTPRSPFPPAAVPPYDATRLRVENMERQLANLTGLVQKALTQPAATHLQVPGRESYRERDRLKPAPPPKPASLSPGQYDSRIYRDLQLTPEMYNQLRGLQKKAKDLRAEVRNLRRMSQAQAHSVKETIRDTFIKIRAMLLAGGEQVWQAGMDQERVRLTREEDLYKQEMLRLEKDLSDLESTVEELRGNVINRKTRVNMSDVENMALVLSKSSKTVADLKLRFPGLQDGMKAFLSTEMEKVMREEKFLKEEPERLESALRRCKKLTGTLVTLKRLASVQEQRLPNSNDGRLSPTSTETPPVTPSSTHSKPPTAPRVGSLIVGGDSSPSDSGQRPENALDALLDELQTFSKPHSNAQPQDTSDPPAIPVKGNRPPQMSEIGRKGSMDSASFLPTQNLSVSTATGSLRRLHSYPSGSDTDNSPPIQPLQRDNKTTAKPPLPERNTELLQHVVTGKRVPPPPPPRTSSKSPLASPTSPSLPPRSPATALQHIQNVQNMVDKPMSQFEQATQNLGLQTLRRNVPNRSSIKDKSQTLPRNIGSNLQIPVESDVISASNSSSCESVNSQDGSKKTRKEELEQRHQELLKKQKALQEQYARLQQLQRGNNTLTVIPPAPDQLLKKTGSESNLLQKMGLQLSTSQITGSLTNLPNTSANAITKSTPTSTNSNPANPATHNNIDDQSKSSSNPNTTNTQTNKVYETDIL